jgi:hypothetical protein
MCHRFCVLSCACGAKKEVVKKNRLSDFSAKVLGSTWLRPQHTIIQALKEERHSLEVLSGAKLKLINQ